MDKRLLIVLPLCMLILIGWSYLFPPPQPRPAARDAAPAAAAPAAAAARTGNSPSDAPAEPAPRAAPEAKPALGPRVAASELREETLTVGRPGEPGYFRAVFTNRGGGLLELRTGNYFDRAKLDAAEKEDPAHWVQLLGSGGGTGAISMALRTSESSRDLAGDPLEQELWTMRTLGPDSAPTGVEFELAPGTGVTFKKRFLFVPGEYALRFELEIANDAFAQSGAKQFALTPVGWMRADSGDSWYPEPRALAAPRPRGPALPEPTIVPIDPSGSERQGSLSAAAPLAYAGVDSKYFAVLLRPDGESADATLIGASYRRLYDESWAREHPAEAANGWRQVVADVDLQVMLPPAGESRTWTYALYAGPKDRTLLEKASPIYGELVDRDLRVWFFGPGISAVMVYVLQFFEWITGNWGIAIILLTFSVRLLLFPVNRRSQTAMSRYAAKMKRLQPKIEELKKKYEHDAATLRQEQTKLMQKEGAFPPLGGCLPMFIQIPVFIGLFRALGVSFDLRQAPFYGWIADLSLPDRVMPLGWSVPLPLFGPLNIDYLNLLPPLMVALWIWQQKGMPTPADEQAARMQKMMLWMPVMMGFFLYNYAAGLSLYMITQSGLGVFEQKVIRKYWPVDDKELPTKKKSGFMAKLMEAQEQQMKKMQTQKNTARRVRR